MLHCRCGHRPPRTGFGSHTVVVAAEPVAEQVEAAAPEVEAVLGVAVAVQVGLAVEPVAGVLAEVEAAVAGSVAAALAGVCP